MSFALSNKLSRDNPSQQPRLSDLFVSMNQDVHVPMSPQELPGKGKVIAFMPLIPGSGATTLALYAVFSLMAGQREIAVADLTPWGKARTYLGLLPQDYPASILDVLEHEEDEDITRFGVLHPFGFYVYPGVIRRLDAVLELGPDPTVGMRIAGALKRAFDVTVLILPPLEASGWAGGMIADHVYLVVPPQRVALDVYADVMAALERFGMRGAGDDHPQLAPEAGNDGGGRCCPRNPSLRCAPLRSARGGGGKPSAAGRSAPVPTGI